MLLAAAFLIGSHACRPCHTAIADAYAQTPMARSSGRVESIAPASFTAAGHRYRIAGKQLMFDAGPDGGSVSVDYFIGSNAAGRSFLREREGYLFELPVTWYSQRQMWDTSPGYEHDPQIRLNRAVEPSCLSCHASRVRPVLGTQNRYGDPPFLEDGVGCERCHGPGSEHAKDPARFPLINPSGLDPERRDSVCSQCHLTGEARVEQPGRRFAEFQAGERLSDYATYLVWSRERADLKVTSHVEKLAASACKRSAGDALWCGTCHDLHTNADRTQAACLGCHATAHRQQENCASCHMPKTRALDANHGVLTDHSIPRIPAVQAQRAGERLVGFLGVADDRALGLAYASLGDARAREYLVRASPADGEVKLRLAAMETDPARAAVLYEAVLKSNPSQVIALVNLGSIYAGMGRVADAARLWGRALDANPGLEEAVMNLVQIQTPVQARATLKRYLEFNPASSVARAKLQSLQNEKVPLTPP
jgi:hypothetical protein